MLLFNGLLYLHFAAFLVYLSTLLLQWNEPVKRTNEWMLRCGITLLLTGAGLVAVRFPEINYWKVVPKSVLFLAIAVITATHKKRTLSLQTWRLLIGMTLLAAAIALWRVG